MTRRKILLITIPSLIFLCMFGGFLFIRSDYFLKYLKSQLETGIQNHIDDKYKVEVGTLSGNVLTGVQVKSFNLSENASKEAVVSTEEITVKYKLLALLRRKFLVTALEISTPQIYARRDADNQINLTQLLKQKASDSNETPFAFAVSEVDIKNGKLQFTDKQRNLEMILPEIEVTLDGPLEAWAHKGTVSVGKGRFALNGKALPIEPFEKVKFSVSADSGGMEETLRLKLGNSVLQIKGNWEKDAWQMDADLTIDPADVQKFVTPQYTLKGEPAAITLNARETEAGLTGSLTATLQSISVNDILMEALAVSADFTDETFRVKQITGKIAGGEISGTGKIVKTAAGEAGQFSYDGEIFVKDIQLPPFLSMLVDLPEGNPHINSGMLAGKAIVQGNTSRMLHVESSLQLSETTFLVKSDTSDDTSMISLRDSDIACTISTSGEGDTKITATGNLDEARIGLEGTYDSLNLTLHSIGFGKILKILNSAPFAGVGHLTAEITKGKTATGHLEIPTATFMGTPIGRLAGDFRYADKVMFIENAHLTKKGVSGDSSVSITGKVDIVGELPANLRIIVEPIVLDAEYNTLFLGGPQDVHGTLTGELNLDGTLMHLNGNGTLTVSDGKAWGIHLDTLTLPLEIEDYAITVSNFEITTRGQQIILNAVVDNNGDFEVSLKNRLDTPIQLAEIAAAANITDFPFDAKLDVNVALGQEKPNDFEFLIECNATDITFDSNPLGDAYLAGTLIEQKRLTGDPDFFRFKGDAFEGTTQIEGTISTAVENPYQFVLTSIGINVSPILRIFHPTLEQITGTADSVVKIEGTIAELAPPPGEMDNEDNKKPDNRRVHPYNVDIKISDTQLHYNTLDLTNRQPIHIKLVDDLWTVLAFSLTADTEQSPFIQIDGTYDAKGEEMNLRVRSLPNEHFALAPLSKIFRLPISGTATYLLHATGTLPNPRVNVNYTVPTLTIQTEIGDINLSHGRGGLTYRNNTVTVEPSTLVVLGNALQVEGDVTIQPENVNTSALNLHLTADKLDLAKFEEIVTNIMPPEVLKRLTQNNHEQSAVRLLEGQLTTSLYITGTLTQPTIAIGANTTHAAPIRLKPFAKPITLTRLRAVTTATSKSVHINTLEANGWIGEGTFQVKANETTFPVIERSKAEQFNIEIAVTKLEVSDFATLFYEGDEKSPVHGTVTGKLNVAGTGFSPNLITTSCGITELNLQIYNTQIVSTAAFEIRYDKEALDAYLPLQITSSTMQTTSNIRIEGTPIAPIVTLNWVGEFDTPSPLQWRGDVQYRNQQITVEQIELTYNKNDTLTLTGEIPCDLRFAAMDISERFLDNPLSVQLSGQEIPLHFFPGLDTHFSEITAGVIDINLQLLGTPRAPYLHGDFSVQADRLYAHRFNQTLTDATFQLKAQRNSIEVTKLQFKIEGSECTIDSGQLQLDGLIPKQFRLEGFTLTKYPVGAVVERAVSTDILTEIDGHITARLETLTIPFDTFFQEGKNEESSIFHQLPIISEIPSADTLLEVSAAKFAIDTLNFAFTALGKHYNFHNPHPIEIKLSEGILTLEEGFTLQDKAAPASTDAQESGASVNPIILSGFGKWDHHKLWGDVMLKNLDVSVLNALPSWPNEYSVTGVLSTNIRIRGNDTAPEVTVECKGDKIGINQAEIHEFEAELRYADQEWKIEENGARLKFGKNELTCTGTLPYLLSLTPFRAEPLPKPITGSLTFKMEELTPLLLIVPYPYITAASGKGELTAYFSGTLSNPKIEGTGNLSDIALDIPTASISLKDTMCNFKFSEQALELEELHGALNRDLNREGRFFVTGTIDLENRDMNLETTLNDTSFAQSELFQFDIATANLQLRGPVTEPRLTGDIDIRDGYYQQNWGLVRDWLSGTTVTEADRALDNILLSNLYLDVEVQIKKPNDFRLLSSLTLYALLTGSADISIACSGKLIGSIQRPVFTGDMSLLSGNIKFPTGTVFEFVEKDVALQNENPVAFNPVLDISFQTPNPIRGVFLKDGSTADMIIRFDVTGSLLDNPNTRLKAVPLNTTSTEVLTESEIIALLLPNKAFSAILGGITFTVSSGLEPDTRHISAVYPLPFGKNIFLKMERDQKGEYGADIQWEGRF